MPNSAVSAAAMGHASRLPKVQAEPHFPTKGQVTKLLLTLSLVLRRGPTAPNQARPEHVFGAGPPESEFVLAQN